MPHEPQRHVSLTLLLLAGALTLAGCGPAGGPGADGPGRRGATVDPATLRERIGELAASSSPTVDGTAIAAMSILPRVYEERGWRPAFTDPARVEALYRLVQSSVDHGLNPEDFHVHQIRDRLRAPLDDPAFLADSEVLFADALARLAVTLHFGKLDPATLDQAWNYDRSFGTIDRVEALAGILDSEDLAAAVEAFAPHIPFYTGLRRALATYRGIQADGGWPAIPAGPVLEEGSRGERVALLRQRLRATGDLAGAPGPDPELFDATLAEAVRTFQSRHGIDADGRVGPGTLEQLDVPVETRLDQIRANMERIRWVFRNIPDDFLVVDIAGFRAHLYRGGKEIWSTRVQVGQARHETPVFRSAMDVIEFNPTWTIPPGITRNETLPAIRRNPGYLAAHHMIVITRSGSVVDPSTIDWAATKNGGFPYMIRQQPGPWNALGQVKFLFPNPYMVYLHDTPSKAKFGRTERAFSHGCIRTEHPLDLAALVLADQGWDRERIDRVITSRKTTRVRLDTPLPVFLLYWTAEVADDGTVLFRKDLYGRDARIVEGLKEPLAVQPPPPPTPETQPQSERRNREESSQAGSG